MGMIPMMILCMSNLNVIGSESTVQDFSGLSLLSHGYHNTKESLLGLLNSVDINALPKDKLYLILNITNDLLHHARHLKLDYDHNITVRKLYFEEKQKEWHTSWLKMLELWGEVETLPEHGPYDAAKKKYEEAETTRTLAKNNYEHYADSLNNSTHQSTMDALHEIETYVQKLKTGTKNPTAIPTATPTFSPTPTPTSRPTLPPTPRPTPRPSENPTPYETRAPTASAPPTPWPTSPPDSGASEATNAPQVPPPNEGM